MNADLFRTGQYNDFILSLLTADCIDDTMNSSDIVHDVIEMLYNKENANARLVYSHGGSTGDGELVERVFFFKDGGVELGHLLFTGFYTSDEGTTYDSDITRVYPREVIVTKYFDTPN